MGCMDKTSVNNKDNPRESLENSLETNKNRYLENYP